MEQLLHEKKMYPFEFKGTGKDYFGIVIINWLLTIITLGLYYPWAKANKLKFLYNTTFFDGDNFMFHGTGNEMFKGFIKAIAIIAGIFILFNVFVHFFEMPILGILILYGGIILIMPLAIHGSYRYRMSRTSWRGIRFGYVGNRNEFFKEYLKWIFYTIISLGIYSPWLVVNMRKYVIGNIRLGSAQFKYKGDGGEYFGITLMSYLLTIITVGIYWFWWQKNLFEFYVNNLYIEHNGNTITLKSKATGGGFFKLMSINLILIIITLGFGYSWVVTRTMKFVCENIEIEGSIDLETLIQSHDNYNNATGEDLSDFFDLDFVL